jgi:hypothetical protein
MPSWCWLLGALACAYAGMGFLALAMKRHWADVRGSTPPPPAIPRTLRALGCFALLLSLVLCFFSDHASMAPLVWVMSLSASALAVALTLSFRPRVLAVLVAWVS